MAGTIPSLSLAQFNDANGLPDRGAKLYLYEAGTSIPVVAYKDNALTSGQEHPFPIVADSYGLIPAFWLDDGDYRVRLTDRNGVVRFDIQSFPALGSSGGGGGGSTTIVSTFVTGDVDWQPMSGARSGWVRHNGRTIGSASSGASERANADCQPLFETLWQRHANTICAVSGGRGVSANADWAANKTLTLLDLRGKTPVGLDDMGNTAAGRFAGTTFSAGDATTAGAAGGVATVTLAETQIPAHTHVLTIGSAGGHSHEVGSRDSETSFGVNPSTEFISNIPSPSGSPNVTTSAVADHTHTGTAASTGGGTAHDNLPPFALGTFYCRL